jgi:hypothetical protein
MTQPSAKRPWRIIFACLILISGAALIATSPHFIKSGLQKYQTAFYTMPAGADLQLASTFVFGKSLEVSEAKTEHLGIVFTRFPFPVKMALEQASTTVRGIDSVMGSQVDRPRGIYRVS